MTTRKRSSWLWIVGAVIAPLLLYVLSFGPACWWLTQKSKWGQERVSSIYAPILYVAQKCYQPSHADGGTVYRTIAWYVTLKHPRVIVPAKCFDDNGSFGQFDRPLGFACRCSDGWRAGRVTLTTIDPPPVGDAACVGAFFPPDHPAPPQAASPTENGLQPLLCIAYTSPHDPTQTPIRNLDRDPDPRHACVVCPVVRAGLLVASPSADDDSRRSRNRASRPEDLLADRSSGTTICEENGTSRLLLQVHRLVRHTRDGSDLRPHEQHRYHRT